MTKLAICVDKLSKLYHIGTAPTGAYRTLRETISDALAVPWQCLRRRAQQACVKDGETRAIWALRDVSFEVAPGEVIGIIGRNGAGKSTLLKVLSRIVEPSHGQAKLRGRLASLLEVGTGFHPELTGRENIYMNGSILGMTREEINRKFDDIVAFSELEQFLDTPVKRYSSGMYVRLAFAVAAHLEPEILVVDEVLAVGDATFQRKCLNLMHKLGQSGITIVFVSHSMDLIPKLCTSALLLEKGEILRQGPATSVVQEYLSRQVDGTDVQDMCDKSRHGDGRARFTKLQLVDATGSIRPTHTSGSDLILKMDIEAYQDVSDVAFAIVLSTLSGTRVVTSWTKELDYHVELHKGVQSYECCFRNLCFRPGHRIDVMLWMDSSGVIDCIEHARVIEITAGEDHRHLSTEKYQGIVLSEYSWSRTS